MSEQVQNLLDQVRQLPAGERRDFTEKLLDDPELWEWAEDHWSDPEWRAEMDRRLQSVEDGTGDLIPWDQAYGELKAELARRRAARQQP